MTETLQDKIDSIEELHYESRLEVSIKINKAIQELREECNKLIPPRDMYPIAHLHYLNCINEVLALIGEKK